MGVNFRIGCDTELSDVRLRGGRTGIAGPKLQFGYARASPISLSNSHDLGCGKTKDRLS